MNDYFFRLYEYTYIWFRYTIHSFMLHVNKKRKINYIVCNYIQNEQTNKPIGYLMFYLRYKVYDFRICEYEVLTGNNFRSILIIIFVVYVSGIVLQIMQIIY